MHGKHGWKCKGWFTLGDDGRIKKYKLDFNESIWVKIPANAVYIQKDASSVTVYCCEPDVIESDMCRIPYTWLGRTLEFKAINDVV